MMLNMRNVAEISDSPHLPGVISPNQTVAARGLLRWSQSKLAEMAGVSRRTLEKFENGSDISSDNIDAIQHAIEAAGVFPIEEDRWGGEGVRRAKTKVQD